MSLSLHNINVAYGQRHALRDVSLSIEKPCLVGIIGPNGAGKSTLLKSIAGLAAKTGSISLDSVQLHNQPSADAARIVAYCAQSSFPAWPITVEEVVQLGRLPHRNASDHHAEDALATQRAIEKLALSRLAQRNIDSLSGGERSRAMLARALSTEARILLVDEPTADLDPYHELKTMEVLQAEARSNVYILAVLHNLSLAAQYCDVLVVLKDGMITAQGNPTEVLTQDLLNEVYGIEALIEPHADSVVVMPLRRLD